MVTLLLKLPTFWASSNTIVILWTVPVIGTNGGGLNPITMPHAAAEPRPSGSDYLHIGRGELQPTKKNRYLHSVRSWIFLLLVRTALGW